MATLITKNSSTASAVPAAGDLVKGELAVNVTDKKVYTKDNSAAVVKLVGSLGNQEANAVAITGGAINGTTIGATTPSTGAFTTASASGGFTGNLTGNVTGNVSGTAANVTGVVAIANGGTGLSSLGTGVQSALGQAVTGSGSFVLSTSPSLTTPNLGTPSAAVLTNATGLPLTTGVTGTLGVANGGTGQTTANAAFNALAPSQSTHAGKYLKTDGTNTSWDAIEINTADITGTLPVANGGTGTSTALTSGSVVFAGASGVYSQNNTNFFWDNTTSSLGIGTPTPVGKLHLNVSSGAIYYRISSGVNAMLMGGLAGASGEVSSNGDLVFGAGTSFAERGRYSSDGTFRVKGAGTAGSTDAFQVSGSAPANSFILNSSGNITLASPGTFTYSSGTANGVAYLNGSKVLTTGSALTYNGSVLGVADGSITAGNTAVVLTGKYSSGFPTTGAGYFQLQTNNVDGTTGGLTVLTNSAGTLRQSYRIHEDTTAAACYQSWNVGGSEQARLTSTGLGIGTSSPSAPLQFGKSVYGAVTSEDFYRIKIQDAGGIANDVGIGQPASGAMGFNVVASTGYYQWDLGTNGTAMTLNASGNLGIGTTSPTEKLAVAGNIRSSGNIFAGVGNANASVQVLSSVSAGGAGNSELYLGNATSSTQGYLSYSHASNNLLFGTNTTTKMTLDASGNLGLGVTPSSWGSGQKAFETQAGSLAALSTSLFDLVQNTYNSGTGYIYKTTAAATVYRQTAGQHLWFNAASGTAGNTISFTQAMTLDASGNLLVGRTSRIITETFSSTGYGLFGGATVQGIIGDAGSGLVTVGAYSNHALELRTNNTERARITSGGNFATFGDFQLWPSAGGGAGSYSIRRAATNALSFNYDFTGAELARFTSGGEFLVGTTSPAGSSQITAYGATNGQIAVQNSTNWSRILQNGNDLYFDNGTGGTGGNIIFRNGSSTTERARITSGGNLLVGTTDVTPYNNNSNTSADNGVVISNTGQVWAAAYNSDCGNFNRTGSDGASLYFNRSGSTVGSISVTTTATAFNTSSDYRLKNNPQPLTGSGAFIDALKPKTWNWTADGSRGVGFIAHEVQEVSPGSVVGTKDAVDEEGKPIMQAMEYGSAEFIANIIAELQSLRARVAQLEAK